MATKEVVDKLKERKVGSIEQHKQKLVDELWALLVEIVYPHTVRAEFMEQVRKISSVIGKEKVSEEEINSLKLAVNDLATPFKYPVRWIEDLVKQARKIEVGNWTALDEWMKAYDFGKY